ncbi:helix-turn-helix domain-containing protein [Streptococcus salivarius]|jgi:repressor LexA|uniref:helix-turn-helix domain-containing protein n=1 Tax=Streptococcus salivarius TaxID=1304 RepID=UPI0022E78A8E|nr:LexA family transcriptional regulator [Streptococcus salivarius]
MKECKDSNNLMGEMFTDRLIKLRQARGWTKKEFSAKIGKTQQTVGKWENGSNAPTFKDLVKLVGLFGVTSDYLLGLSDSPSKYAYPPINDNKQEQVEEMFKELDEGNQDATVDFIENRLDNQHISKEIKENDLKKQIVINDERPTKRISIYARVNSQGFELSEVPVDCLDYPVPIPVHDIAIKVVGKSMEPSFFDDEVLFIMKDSILRAGDISIVQINSRFFVMKVGQNRENGDILLNSLNSDKPPITLSEKDDFIIFGKVVLM